MLGRYKHKVTSFFPPSPLVSTRASSWRRGRFPRCLTTPHPSACSPGTTTGKRPATAGGCDTEKAPTLKAVCLRRQEAAALLQQEPAGRGGEVLRAADGSPGGDPRRDHPAALQAAGQQAVGAVTQPAALGPHCSRWN